jgi:hypothetical protein
MIKPCRPTVVGTFALFAFAAVTARSGDAGAGSEEAPAAVLPPGAPAAAAPVASTPVTPAPDGPDPERVLERALRSSGRDGLAEAQALVGDPRAPWAATVARLCGNILRQAPATVPPPGGSTGANTGTGTNEGRGRLVLWSSLYGIWLGIATDVLFDIDGDRAIILPPLLGMAAGLGLSLAATRHVRLSVGEAWTIITGMDYGTINGALWAGGFDLDSEGVVGTAVATGIAASSIGLLVANKYSPSSGDIELVRSSLLWGTLSGFLATAVISPDASSQGAFTAAGLSMNLSLLAGIGLANYFDLSRNRVLIIDAGALAGGLTGLGIAWLSSGGDSPRALAGASLGGILAGIAVAAITTRDLDADDDVRAAGRFPALFARDAAGRWGFGRPGPIPVFDGTGRRLVGATATALGGVF